MRFESRSFWLSKDFSFPNEYQDAFQLDAERGIVAIADGVGSAIFSGCWARILTQGAVAEPPQPQGAELFQAWLARQRANWTGQIDTSRLTWFQRPKMIDGAMSTLLWIELASNAEEKGEPQSAYRLNGWAIGDCCLFHVRENQLLRSFPITSAAEFGLNPAVLGSIDRKQDHLIEFQELHVTCWPSDLLVLCSDAVALWAMNRYEAGETIAWETYWDMPSEVWQEEIFAQREANLMRFDDTTLVLLRLAPITEDLSPPGNSSSFPAGLPLVVSERTLESAELTAAGNDLLPLALSGENDEPNAASPEGGGDFQEQEETGASGINPMRRVLTLARSYLAPWNAKRELEIGSPPLAQEAKQHCEEHSAIPTDAEKPDKPFGDG
jgi:hypothetical protein